MDVASEPDTLDKIGEIVQFMKGFSVEVTPREAKKIADFRSMLRLDTDVYITFLPGSDFADTCRLAARLRREGMNPIPHIAARSVPNANFLDEGLARLCGEAGVDQVLIIGGAVAEPIGEFSDTMQLLDTGHFDSHGIRRIGVAGHPEGSPDISEEAIEKALTWKNDFATRSDAAFYVVTQFCFESAPIIAWDKRIRAAGNRLPIHIGIPGLATIKTLIAHANSCGIGPSARFVVKHARDVARLMAVSTPDRLVADLARYKASDPACGITKAHMYSLGGLVKSTRWAYGVVDGKMWLNADGGFTVDAVRAEGRGA